MGTGLYSGKNSDFVKLILSMTNRYQTWEVWTDFITMMALGLSQPLDYHEKREKRYLEICAKHSGEDLEKFSEMAGMVIQEFEDNRYQDLLGSLYMALDLGNHWTGQFFTPYHLCEAMAQINTEQATETIFSDGYVTIHDCACGAGATLIAGVNAMQEHLNKKQPVLNYQNHVLAIAQDLSETTALMCYVQLSLLGIAAIVKVGDSIADPFAYDVLDCPHDENLYFTPMYFGDVWNGRRMAHMLDIRKNGVR